MMRALPRLHYYLQCLYSFRHRNGDSQLPSNSETSAHQIAIQPAICVNQSIFLQQHTDHFTDHQQPTSRPVVLPRPEELFFLSQLPLHHQPAHIPIIVKIERANLHNL